MNISEAIDHLRRVHEETPTSLFAPTPDDAANAEQRLNVCFHPDYRRFLMEASS
ncbi:MAG: SMI1/KNR4 family protein [Capsulimonas sp.]|uniref:SMI1/KNR4 family protein n=1 Tax=Capsulimonas sp. TaxID=2494211 RepID=UPI0032679B5D